jgi:uncharacterized membrane protein
VLGALGVGAALMSGAKGDRLHRTLGWIWSVFMVATAISALFINPQGGPPTLLFLKLFSVFTLITTPFAVAAARRHNVARHASAMTGLFVGGLGIAGMLAFLPGRLVWQVFFG